MPAKSNYSLPAFLLGTCFLIFLAGCHKESNIRTYTLYKPVYKLKSDVLAGINGNPGQPVETAGKIYIKDNFIFVNEVDKGIHIIDNRKPAHPVSIAFLSIPGNLDMAVKGNVLYADMYGDLLAIDIADPKHARVSSLLPGLFKERTWYSSFSNGTNPGNQVLVDWIKKDTTVNLDDVRPVMDDCAGCLYDYSTTANSTGSFSPGAGVAGSMARMVLMNDYLYALTAADSLAIVDTRNPTTPGFVSNWYAGFELQTLYPFNNKLFLGSARGLFMYDLTNPENPVTLGQFSHGRACDPVVTDGDYAYVTLHAGTPCGGSENELTIVSINNLLAPRLARAYPMTKPTGLCKDGDLLFVCDGASGIKMYDATIPADLKLLQQIRNIDGYDIIAANHLAIVVTKAGLYQYDYTDIHHLRLLSFFSAKTKR